MYYTKENFWVKTGTQFIWFFSTYRNIDISIDELEDFISNRDYLSTKESNIFTDDVINLVKAWDYIRLVVLNFKDDLEGNKKFTDAFNLDVLTTIYKILDPSEEYCNQFIVENDKKTIFIKKLFILIKELDDTSDVNEILEKFCFSLYDFIVHKYIGEWTTIMFFCYFTQMAFICKDIGPILFNDIDDLNYVLELSKKVTTFLETNDKSKWKNCEELKELETIWNDKIEFFNLVKDNF
ncbi:hypothetical protein SLITO_v1c02880 [Spiroplasma litorale]|uniref:Uncharacterized protein n=1 Tax=Spiroplasma litorale TaxID=216942 RepID=A0A0K1W196_9MOLU|nr:hypothetical protein [Spiroplasma litorale]AKX33943.1 hypothetical protein SLITO_v1c02880 [Spiroplasma litorale]